MENSLHAEYTCVDRVIPRLLGDPTGQGSTSQVRKQVQRKGVTGLGHTLVSRGPRRLEEVLTTSVCLSRAGGREVASQIRGDLPVLYRIGWAKAPVPCWSLWATWVRDRGRRSQAHTSGGTGSKASPLSSQAHLISLASCSDLGPKSSVCKEPSNSAIYVEP